MKRSLFLLAILIAMKVRAGSDWTQYEKRNFIFWSKNQPGIDTALIRKAFNVIWDSGHAVFFKNTETIDSLKKTGNKEYIVLYCFNGEMAASMLEDWNHTTNFNYIEAGFPLYDKMDPSMTDRQMKQHFLADYEVVLTNLKYNILQEVHKKTIKRKEFFDQQVAQSPSLSNYILLIEDNYCPSDTSLLADHSLYSGRIMKCSGSFLDSVIINRVSGYAYIKLTKCYLGRYDHFGYMIYDASNETYLAFSSGNIHKNGISTNPYGTQSTIALPPTVYFPITKDNLSDFQSFYIKLAPH